MDFELTNEQREIQALARDFAQAEIEPHAAGIRALHSPGTGIIDFGRVVEVMADELRAEGLVPDG